MLDKSERQSDLQEAIRDAQEELFLLRCTLQSLMEAEKRLEFHILWRLSDYLQQHISGIPRLCR